MHDDHVFMQEALSQAKKAYDRDEVPVGAVLVKDGAIISRAHNQPIAQNDPTAHAEIMALRAAGEALKNYRLLDTTLYVTLEPCAMCAMALVHARIKRLVYATNDPRTGACQSVFQLLEEPSLNHRILVSSGVLQEEAGELLKNFFRSKR